MQSLQTQDEGIQSQLEIAIKHETNIICPLTKEDSFHNHTPHQ